MRILVACPTLAGREESLDVCKESYKKTVGDATLRFSIPVDCKSWGEGVNEALSEADELWGLDSFDYIHLTADDLEAHEGWLDAAVETLGKGQYPAPHLLNPDGSTFSFGHGDSNMFDTSHDWKPTNTSVIPTFTPLMWKMMGPMIPIQYFTDNYMSHKARLIGMHTVARLPYLFTHHASDVLPNGSRNDRLQEDQAIYKHYLQTGEMPS
jgi:hypothetical protein